MSKYMAENAVMFNEKQKLWFAISAIILIVIIAVVFYISGAMPAPEENIVVSQENKNVTNVTPTMVPAIATVPVVTVPRVFLMDIFGADVCSRNVLTVDEANAKLNFFDALIGVSLNSRNVLNAEDFMDKRISQQIKERKNKVLFVPGKTIDQVVYATRSGPVLLKNVTATSLPDDYVSYRLWGDNPMMRGKIYVIATFNCRDELVSMASVDGGVTKKIEVSSGYSNEDSSGASNDAGSGGGDDGGDDEEGSPVDDKV